jgi:hypothetical protein
MGVIEEEQLTHTCQAVIDDTLTLHDLAQTP